MRTSHDKRAFVHVSGPGDNGVRIYLPDMIDIVDRHSAAAQAQQLHTKGTGCAQSLSDSSAAGHGSCTENIGLLHTGSSVEIDILQKPLGVTLTWARGRAS